DAEIVDPVAQVPAQARLIDRQVGRKRRQRRRPNALEILAGGILCLASAGVYRGPCLAGFCWRVFSLSAWASPRFFFGAPRRPHRPARPGGEIRMPDARGTPRSPRVADL